MLNNSFIKLLLFCIFTLLISGNAFSQGEDFEKEHKKLDSIINCANCSDTLILSAYIDLAELLYVSNMDTVIYLSNVVLDIIDKVRYKYDDSATLQSFDNNISAAYNNIGYVYYNKGNIPIALEYFIRALKILEANKEYEGVAILLNNIGVIYNKEGGFETSLTYHERALKLHQDGLNKNGEASTLNKIGDIYRNLNKVATAEMYYLQSNNIFFTLKKEKLGISSNYSSLYELKMDEGDLEKAMEYAVLMLEVSERLNYKIGITQANYNISKILAKNGAVDEAISKALVCLQFSEASGLKVLISEVSHFLSGLYEGKGEESKALVMYKLYFKVKLELLNKESIKSIAQQKEIFEYEQKIAEDSILQQETLKIKNTEIALSKAESEKNKLQIAQQKKQQWFLFIGLGLVALFGGFMFNRFRITKRQKGIITEQKEISDFQKTEIQKQHLLLEETHGEIKDSIRYAKRLQNAILPSFEDVNVYLPNSFVFFKPKDVVSGDFYWFEHLKGVSYIAVADCTGHGVPGALVSVVCSNALNRSVKEFGLTEPASILNKTRELVIETFAKSGEGIKDGMDIALCAIDQFKVVYSGAGNPLWIVKDIDRLSRSEKSNDRNMILGSKVLIEVKGDKQPIGLYEGMKPFSQVEVELVKGDLVYLFTDGYADQFGGEKGKKYKYKPFKKLFLEMNNLSMKEQQEKLDLNFDKWKGDLEQIDDVCVMGLKFI